MRFAAPEFLWLLLLGPAVALGSYWAYAGRMRALARFAGGTDYVHRFTAEVSRDRRAIKLLLVFVGLLLLPLALARPQWGSRLEPITRRGADVVIALDTSLSMSTEDLAPSRLGQAKHAIGTLLDRLAGDRVALVSFAGQAGVSCPLTVDHSAVRMFLEAVDVESVPLPGTALAQAVEASLRAFRFGEAEVDRGRAIVVFSDGEDHAGGMEQLSKQLERRGVAVYAVGTGTTRGAPIPLRDPTGMLIGYKKDAEGRVVTSRLNEQVLESLALASGGRYYRATSGEVEIDEIGRVLGALSQGELGSELRTRYEERFQIPLLLAWLALAADALLGDRRRRRRAAATATVGREVA